MGWGSGVYLFDDAVRIAFAYAAFISEQEEQDIKLSIVRSLYKCDSFRHSDWDTQQESDYFDPYLRQVMIELGELDVCPTCKDIQCDMYNGKIECYNEECPDSKYYEGPND